MTGSAISHQYKSRSKRRVDFNGLLDIFGRVRREVPMLNIQISD